MKKFIIYWNYNRTSVVTGSTIEEAFSNAGYGKVAMPAVNFYEEYIEDEQPKYVWNHVTKNWDRILPIIDTTHWNPRTQLC